MKGKKIDTKNIKRGLVNFWNNAKKLLKKAWTFIKRTAIKLRDKFMELPKKVRLVIYVWAVVILVLLLFIGISNGVNKFYNKYETMESTVSTKALEYVKSKSIYTTQGNKLKIDLETLKEEGFVKDGAIEDETCEGISVVYYDDEKEEYVVDTYLNCDRYTTKNYWDYK